MRKGKSCELKPSFLKWYPISLSLHSYTQIGDETGIRGVELRSKDRVTLHLNLLPSNNWCYPICIYVFEFPAIHSSCRPIYLPSNFQAENASGCIFSCWVLEHQAPVFAKTMGTDETCITITYNESTRSLVKNAVQLWRVSILKRNPRGVNLIYEHATYFL